MLVHQRAFAQHQIAEIQRERKNFRRNASEDALIHQDQRLAKIDECEQDMQSIDLEIARRKKAGTFDPKPVEREALAKKGAPVPPNLKPAKSASVEYLEGEELPIKIMDRGYPRAWRPEDGPIHDSDPTKTITDVSQTTNKKSE